MDLRDLKFQLTRSVEQIAEQCGYQSDVAFTKAYKKATGRTPKQMRSKQTGTLFGKAARLFLGPSS